MSELLPILEKLARGAGDITLRYFQTDIAVQLKENQTPVTIADQEAEQLLRCEILKLFPDDQVVGEEFGESEAKPGSRRWIVDPIDGTRTFIRGVPLYGVMIGVEQDAQIIAGAVLIPPLNEMVVAQRGAGCWWNGNRARVSTIAKLSDSLLCTTDHMSNYSYGRGELWDKLVPRVKLIRTWGDCYGHLLVATGRAEIMVDPKMSPWDCAALKIILEEAGGTFTDYEGTPTIYGDCAISTNSAVLEEVLSFTAG